MSSSHWRASRRRAISGCSRVTLFQRSLPRVRSSDGGATCKSVFSRSDRPSRRSSPDAIILLGYGHHENIGVGLVVFPVSIILLSIIFGWLRMKTGSIWSSSIAHGATDSFGASLALLFFLGGPKFTFVGYLGILSWITLGALCAWILLTQAADYNDSSLTTEGSAERVGDRV